MEGKSLSVPVRTSRYMMTTSTTELRSVRSYVLGLVRGTSRAGRRNSVPSKLNLSPLKNTILTGSDGNSLFVCSVLGEPRSVTLCRRVRGARSWDEGGKKENTS